MYKQNEKMNLICHGENYDLVYHEYYEQYQILMNDGFEYIIVNNTDASDALETAKKIFKSLE